MSQETPRDRKEQFRRAFEETPFETKPNGHGAGFARARFPFVPWKDLHYDPSKANWLVHKLLPTEGFGVIYGKWKSFKSFIALDIGVCVARGSDWAGRKTKRGIVAYIAGEGGAGLVKRIEAYKLKHGYTDVDLILCRVAPNLGAAPGDVETLVAAIKAILGDRVPVLIIIDTLARTLADRDENNEGMRNFVNNAENLSTAFGCLVMAVHHEGAGDTGRMRGGTTADAGSVATLRISRSDKADYRCTIEVQEAKDEESNFSMVAQLVRFEFGDEHDEDRESTLIVDKIEPSGAADEDKAERKKKVPEGQKAFMTAFDQAVASKGSRRQPLTDGPFVETVSSEQLFEVYSRIRADLKPESRDREFDRQLGSAIKREDLITRDVGGETLIWRAEK